MDSLPTRRFTTEDVARMLDAGVLVEGEHVELLEGRLVEEPRQGPRHSSTLSWLTTRFARAAPEGIVVRPYVPLEIDRESTPEPDIALTPGTLDDWKERHPRGDESLLVVEVALTSHGIDRRKSPIYARGGVPVYWIVDLAKHRLEVHSEPRDGEYTLIRLFAPGQEVEVPGLADTWTVDDILG